MIIFHLGVKEQQVDNGDCDAEEAEALVGNRYVNTTKQKTVNCWFNSLIFYQVHKFVCLCVSPLYLFVCLCISPLYLFVCLCVSPLYLFVCLCVSPLYFTLLES